MTTRYNAERSLFVLYLFCLSVLLSTVQAQENIVVDIVKPKISGNNQIFVFSGTITAKKQSMLSPRVDGLVNEVSVDSGSKVSKGDVLLELDTVIIQKQLNQIKVNVTKAMIERDEAQRVVIEAERLISNKHIPQNELARRKANLELKKAEVLAIKASQETMEETLRRHQLIAPFSGVISHKMTEAGEWVSRGEAVLELVGLNDIRLDVNVPQEHFSALKKETVVRVISDAYPNQSIAGKIQAIVPVSDAQLRAFLVRVAIDNSELSLMPGTSAVAQFEVQRANNHLLIPRDALLNNPDGSVSVFIIENDKAYRRKVELGRTMDNGVNIVKGIDVDDQVVIRGNEVLYDQQPVRINQIRD